MYIYICAKALLSMPRNLVLANKKLEMMVMFGKLFKLNMV